jgi:hypothetical protein
MIYNSNFDDESFKQGAREFNKTIDDPCAIQQRLEDNNKKIKFVTTNHIDLIEGKDTLNFFGMTVKDQLFVPADKMDTFSSLRMGQNGGQLTNPNIKNEFGQLPMPTMPSRYQLFHGDVNIENSMKNEIEPNKRSSNPSDQNFQNRTFYIFDDKQGVETPNPMKSVEPDEFGPRGGKSTRFDK